MYRQAVGPYRCCCSQAPPCSWTAPRLFFGLFFVFKSALLLTDAEPSGGDGQRCPLWTASGRSIGDDHSASLDCIASRLHQCFKFNFAHQKKRTGSKQPYLLVSGRHILLTYMCHIWFHPSPAAQERHQLWTCCIIHSACIWYNEQLLRTCYSVSSQCQLTHYFLVRIKTIELLSDSRYLFMSIGPSQNISCEWQIQVIYLLVFCTHTCILMHLK